MRGEDWNLFAAYRDVDTSIFFPSRGEDVAEARKVCAGCPVIAECREFGLRHRSLLGVWGGLSEQERHRARRKSRAVA